MVEDRIHRQYLKVNDALLLSSGVTGLIRNNYTAETLKGNLVCNLALLQVLTYLIYFIYVYLRYVYVAVCLTFEKGPKQA